MTVFTESVLSEDSSSRLALDTVATLLIVPAVAAGRFDHDGQCGLRALVERIQLADNRPGAWTTLARRGRDKTHVGRQGVCQQYLRCRVAVDPADPKRAYLVMQLARLTRGDASGRLASAP
jgi:hypothetical protein